jgi:hypothetical protein
MRRSSPTATGKETKAGERRRISHLGGCFGSACQGNQLGDCHPDLGGDEGQPCWTDPRIRPEGLGGRGWAADGEAAGQRLLAQQTAAVPLNFGVGSK